MEDLERARQVTGLSWEQGDIILLHTGFLAWYLDQPNRIRDRFASEATRTSVGLGRGPEMLEYLWDSGTVAVAADNPAVEVMPFDLSAEAWPFGFLHQCLIGQLGFALGELWWLHDLSVRCREDGRYASFLTSAPLGVAGGIGSPANAVAVR